MTSHHPQCDWHCDQYDFECCCGATRPRTAAFDALYPSEQSARAEARPASGLDEGVRERLDRWLEGYPEDFGTYEVGEFHRGGVRISLNPADLRALLAKTEGGREVERLRAQLADASEQWGLASTAHQTAQAEIARLRGLLEPFAKAAATLSSRWEDHEDHWQAGLSYPITVGHLRAARAALSEDKQGVG